LAVGAGVALAEAVVAYVGHGVIERAVAQQDLTELDSWGQQLVRLGFLQTTLLIASGVAFLVWEYRMVGNVPSLGGGTPRWSPAMSVVWWFVPVAFLLMPYLVMREVAVRLAWTRSKPTRLVLAWWIAWLVYELTGLVSNAVLSGTGSLESAVTWLQVSALANAGAVFLAILVVRRIQRNAGKRVDRVGTAIPMDSPRT
jgi:hypothetical protein